MPHLMCRHIMPTGELCQSPAVTRRRFCYHHSRQRSITARPKRYGSVRIPFQFPEDRASIQINFHLAAQAVVEGKLEPRQANAITSAYRAAAANLKAGPLAPPRLKHPVERIILTPDEEEIAPAREVCLPGENLTHGPLCPCLYCAETLRNAPGELHHPDCDCGLCHEEEQQAEQEEHKDQPEEQREQEEQMQEQEDEKHDEQDRNLTPAQSAPSDEPLRNSQSSPHPLRPHTSQQSEESAVEQPLSHPQPAPQTGTSSAPASRVGVDGEKSVTLAQQSDESALAAEPSEESVTPAQPSKKSALAAEPSEESVTPAQQSKKSALAAERDAAIRALYQAAEAELAAQTPHAKPAPVAATIPTLLATASNTPKRIKRAPTVTAPPLALPELRDEPAEESEPAHESQPSYQSVLRQYRAELNHRLSSATNTSGHRSPASGRPATHRPGRPLPESIRRYNRLMAAIERNKQLAEESWQRYVAAEQAAGRTVVDPLADRAILITNPDGSTTRRFLTWNEEEDRRIARRRRLLDPQQSSQPAEASDDHRTN